MPKQVTVPGMTSPRGHSAAQSSRRKDTDLRPKESTVLQIWTFFQKLNSSPDTSVCLVISSVSDTSFTDELSELGGEVCFCQ